MEAPHLGDLQVSCLLYADDLVLLSETKEGLQNSLNALKKFTKDWFMEVNPKKTKCLEFARGGKRQEIHEGHHVIFVCLLLGFTHKHTLLNLGPSWWADSALRLFQ